jgi:hypothetical protein
MFVSYGTFVTLDGKEAEIVFSTNEYAVCNIQYTGSNIYEIVLKNCIAVRYYDIFKVHTSTIFLFYSPQASPEIVNVCKVVAKSNLLVKSGIFQIALPLPSLIFLE